MDAIKPSDLVNSLLAAGDAKSRLAPKHLLLRGVLSGALLGFATSLALNAAAQTNVPFVGALIFPVGFVMIVLLGLELVTGNFASVMLAGVDRRTTTALITRNLGWSFLGNLLGSVLYGSLLYISLTTFGQEAPSGIALKIIAAAEAKTLGYAHHETAGLITVFVKAILCNWMVCLGVVMAFTSTSTIGKIAAMWLPILTFFGQGFEHSVVNMFLIPTGMMLGARVSFSDWWMWNQIPVTLGNFVGGFLFTGLFLYWTYRSTPPFSPAPALDAAPSPPSVSSATAAPTAARV